MKEQMSLSEYKKKVIDYYKKTYQTSTEGIENLQKIPDRYWQTLMEDFSAETAAQGLRSGLL